MNNKTTVSHARGPILLLCLLFMILAGCAAFLLLYWHRPGPATAETTPVPVLAIEPRTYTSRYNETTVPTLPPNYLSTPSPSKAPAAAPAASPAPDARYFWIAS